ncbi:MAG: pilin [Patescibacteria group bacterium]
MKKNIIILFLVVLFFTAPLLALGATPGETPAAASGAAGSCPAGKVCLNVPLGNMAKEFNVTDANILGTYFNIWYRLIIGAVGVLAAVMVMWGGFKWLASRGNSSEIGQAKEIIISALIGLVLAFLSFTILYLINPKLTVITMPHLDSVTTPTASTQPVGLASTGSKEEAEKQCQNQCSNNNQEFERVEQGSSPNLWSCFCRDKATTLNYRNGPTDIKANSQEAADQLCFSWCSERYANLVYTHAPKNGDTINTYSCQCYLK